jgi:hypothetical protein
MIHVHKVWEMSGNPTIWITEEIDPATDEAAEHTHRTTWTVSRWNVGTVGVYAREYAVLYDGASTRHGHSDDGSSLGEVVPEAHRNALIEELRLDLSGRKYEQTARFYHWDMEITVPAVE